MMPLCAMVRRRRSDRHCPALGFLFFRQAHEFGMAHGEQRQIEAVGFGDAAAFVVGVAMAVALAVWTVLHGDEAELDQTAVDFLDLGAFEAEGDAASISFEGQTIGREFGFQSCGLV